MGGPGLCGAGPCVGRAAGESAGRGAQGGELRAQSAALSGAQSGGLCARADHQHCKCACHPPRAAQVEKLGLLSKAEQAGFSLSKIEQAGLLSFAEESGILSFIADE